MRSTKKRDIVLKLDRAACAAVLPLLGRDDCCVPSFSSLVETVVLLARDVYIERDDTTFLEQLAMQEAERLMHAARANACFKTCHMTIDPAAIAFIDLLRERNRWLFSNRSDVVTLLLFDVHAHCATEARTAYLMRRFAQVIEKHERD